MFRRIASITAPLAMLALVIAPAQTRADEKKFWLPSDTTRDAIQGLQVPAKDDEPKTRPDTRQYIVRSEQVPAGMEPRIQFQMDGTAEVPLAAPNTVIIQFEPDATEADIESFLSERDLKVIRTYPKIGALQVEGDLSSYFQPQLTDHSANDALLRGLVEVVQDFKSDPRVRSATPDLVLRDQTQHAPTGPRITNLLTPSDVVLSDPAAATETTDWGVADIEADQLWAMPGASDGALFGVMDAGFARHEELVFLELPQDTAVSDHGNHVAAIACARHLNGRGIRGVLPNCFVRARSADIFFTSADGGGPLGFFVLFSQILATLDDFVGAQDDVYTFNVSLGYNWRSNFGINPDLPESAQWRTLVESQGTLLVSLLALAEESGRVIFSAAGNDSQGLATPISAKYASPFNWAAITAREQGIATSGVIVEAHDANGDRAPFSNIGGHISCPGVNIFSAVAFDPLGNVSDHAYGMMSGTSMASPYCAAGQLLFRLVRPGYSGIETVNCLLQSSALSSSGAPMLRLKTALDACPARS